MKRKKKKYNKHGHLFTLAMAGDLRITLLTKNPGFDVIFQFQKKHLDKLAAASFALLGYRVTPGLKKLGLKKDGFVSKKMQGVRWIYDTEWTLYGYGSGGGRGLSLIINGKPGPIFGSAEFRFRGADLKEYKEELCKAAGWELEV